MPIDTTKEWREEKGESWWVEKFYALWDELVGQDSPSDRQFKKCINEIINEELERERERLTREIKGIVEPVIDQMRRLQKATCAYGTAEGDGMTCDCKFLRSDDSIRLGSEENGCCEARNAIRELSRLNSGEGGEK